MMNRLPFFAALAVSVVLVHPVSANAAPETTPSPASTPSPVVPLTWTEQDDPRDVRVSKKDRAAHPRIARGLDVRRADYRLDDTGLTVTVTVNKVYTRPPVAQIVLSSVRGPLRGAKTEVGSSMGWVDRPRSHTVTVAPNGKECEGARFVARPKKRTLTQFIPAACLPDTPRAIQTMNFAEYRGADFGHDVIVTRVPR